MGMVWLKQEGGFRAERRRWEVMAAVPFSKAGDGAVAISMLLLLQLH